MRPLRQKWDGIAISAASLVAYVLLLQDEFLGEDSYVFLCAIGQGLSASSLHPLYAAIAAAVSDVLSTFGVSLFRSLELVSAVGVAIAVLFFHASTFHLQLSRVRRNLATCTVAATPSVVLFATVIEIPGLFLGFASVSWWLVTRQASQPSWHRAALVGVATAAATIVHQTGHLLIVLSVAFLWSYPRRTGPGRVGTALLIAASHLAAFVVLESVFFGSNEKMGQGAALFLSYWENHPRMRVLGIVTWREYLWPLLPLSILAFACLFVRPTQPEAVPRVRIQSVLYHACVVVYTLVSFALIPGLNEHGAYALPLVFFATAIVARALPQRVLIVAVLVAAATALYAVKSQDQPPPDAVSAEDVLALAPDGNALFVVEGRGESDPVVKRAPHLPVMRAFQLAGLPVEGEQLIAWFDGYLAQFHAKGRTIYMSQTARDFLAKHCPELHEHLEREYEMQRVVSGSFVAYIVH